MAAWGWATSPLACCQFGPEPVELVHLPADGAVGLEKGGVEAVGFAPQPGDGLLVSASVLLKALQFGTHRLVSLLVLAGLGPPIVQFGGEGLHRIVKAGVHFFQICHLGPQPVDDLVGGVDGVVERVDDRIGLV